jgi:hypothetical protein
VISAIVGPTSPSRDALPACPNNENPNRLVSLFEMLDFYARDFMGLTDQLSRTVLETSLNLSNQEKLGVFFVELQKLRSHCEPIGLTMSVDQIDRIFRVVSGAQVSSRTCLQCSWTSAREWTMS